MRGQEPTGQGTALLKGAGSRCQAECKPAVCSHGKQGKLHPGLYEQERGQQNEGRYYSLLLGTSNAAPGTLCPAAEGGILEGCLVHGGCRETGEKHC